MVDSPVCLWILVVSTAAINRRRRRLDPRSRVETQRASIRREAQGLGRESSQRFLTFGPERGPGPGQEGWKKRELGLSQLTRVMYAVLEEMDVELEDFRSTRYFHCYFTPPQCTSPGLSQDILRFWHNVI